MKLQSTKIRPQQHSDRDKELESALTNPQVPVLLSSSIAQTIGIKTPPSIWIGESQFTPVKAKEVKTQDGNKDVEDIAKVSSNALQLLTEAFPDDFGKADLSPYKQSFSLLLAGSEFAGSMCDGTTTDKIIDGAKVALGTADILQSISGYFRRQKIISPPLGLR